MLVPWKKSYDQPRQHAKNQSHYFANKVHLVKATVFPVVMYGCENWTHLSHIKLDTHIKRKLSAEGMMLLNCGVGEDS